MAQNEGGEDSVGQLVKLGMTEYQARVYSALVSLGIAGVSEIYRRSKVPRTKIYEALEDLIRQGAVELQAGRPALYRAVNPKSLMARLVEDYEEAANTASKMLERDYQEIRSAEHDVAWTVKGDQAIRRKLADIITSAKEEVLVIETYPPSFTLTVVKLLKAIAQRGVKVRAVSLLVKDQEATNFEENDLIEYRSFPVKERATTLPGELDQGLLGPLSVTLASPYGLAVIDRKEAFVVIPNLGDKSGSVGLSAKIPGVPVMLSVMFQQFLTTKTRKVHL